MGGNKDGAAHVVLFTVVQQLVPVWKLLKHAKLTHLRSKLLSYLEPRPGWQFFFSFLSNSGREMKFHFGASFQWIYQRQQCSYIPQVLSWKLDSNQWYIWDCKSWCDIFGRIKTISKNTLSPLTISSRQKREQDLEAAVFSVSVFSFYWRTELQQRRLGL